MNEISQCAVGILDRYNIGKRETRDRSMCCGGMRNRIWLRALVPLLLDLSILDSAHAYSCQHTSPKINSSHIIITSQSNFHHS